MADFTCSSNKAPVVQILGEAGNTIPFFVAGTDPDIGGTVNQIVDMTVEAVNYNPGFEFIICIETAAAIQVQLANGDNFTITLAQATTYLGDWYPAKLKLVYKVGTTGTFSVGR